VPTRLIIQNSIFQIPNLEFNLQFGIWNLKYGISLAES